MKYLLDPKKARDADDVYTQIPTSGLYIGEITQAKQVFASSRTEGIEFSFKCPAGEASSTIWTSKSDGTLTFGHSLVLALMTCLRKKQCIPVEMMVKEYDATEKKQVEKQGVVYPDLCGNVTIIFQSEEYIKKNGDIGRQLNIKHFLDTELLSASEILDKQIVPTRVELLRDKYQDIKITQSTAPSGAPSYASQANPSYGSPKPQKYFGNESKTPDIEIADDEIPF